MQVSETTFAEVSPHSIHDVFMLPRRVFTTRARPVGRMALR